MVDCCEIFDIEFQWAITAFCLLSVEFSAASLSLARKMTTMASHAAEITAGMEINYKRIDNFECIHGGCMQLVIVYGRIIILVCYL